MIDYKLKGHLLASGVYRTYKSNIKPFRLKQLGYSVNDFDYSRSLMALKGIGLDNIKECIKIEDATWSRLKRLKERISSYMAKGQCLFVTLTFNDECLNSTSEKTRRKYVTRYLKDNAIYYLANIDYGSKNDREHYHAVVVAEKISFKEWRKNGNINAKKIRQTSDYEKVSKYINKLTNHAIKHTNKRQCLIYSKNKSS